MCFCHDDDVGVFVKNMRPSVSYSCDVLMQNCGSSVNICFRCILSVWCLFLFCWVESLLFFLLRAAVAFGWAYIGGLFVFNCFTFLFTLLL